MFQLQEILEYYKVGSPVLHPQMEELQLGWEKSVCSPRSSHDQPMLSIHSFECLHWKDSASNPRSDLLAIYLANLCKARFS